MNDVLYTYYAFVSHSHCDAKWAEWVRKSVGEFRLPTAIRRAAARPLPGRLGRIFLDVADSCAADCAEDWRGALKDSRFLIVLCSPDSARPNAEGRTPIDERVRYFCELGRQDKIIPVLVAGSAEVSFCPALRELNILAIDAAKLSHWQVLERIVSRILNLSEKECVLVFGPKSPRRSSRHIGRWIIILFVLASVLFFARERIFKWYVADEQSRQESRE